MDLFRNIFICASILTVFAIFAHGLAMGLPYWVYWTRNVKMEKKFVDQLKYEGLFKACIEYDNVVHVKNCTMYSNRKDWIRAEQYLSIFSLASLLVTFGADVVVARGFFSTKTYAKVSNTLSVMLILSILLVYVWNTESDAYYVAFGCEIVALSISFISGILRTVVCRGEKHGPYQHIS